MTLCRVFVCVIYLIPKVCNFPHMSMNPASSWSGFTLLSMFIQRALALLMCQTMPGARTIQLLVLRWVREACCVAAFGEVLLSPGFTGQKSQMEMHPSGWSVCLVRTRPRALSPGLHSHMPIIPELERWWQGSEIQGHLSSLSSRAFWTFVPSLG